MKVYFDTEFSDFADPAPLSIGLVTEDGRECYLERTDIDSLALSTFVVDEVLPLFKRMPGAGGTKAEVAYRLSAWLSSLGPDVEMVCDSDIDWLMLHEILVERSQSLVPSNIRLDRRFSYPDRDAYYHDPLEAMRAEAFHEAQDRYYEDEQCPRHHALHDARALRLGAIAMASAQLAGGRAD